MILELKRGIPKYLPRSLLLLMPRIEVVIDWLWCVLLLEKKIFYFSKVMANPNLKQKLSNTFFTSRMEESIHLENKITSFANMQCDITGPFLPIFKAFRFFCSAACCMLGDKNSMQMRKMSRDIGFLCLIRLHRYIHSAGEPLIKTANLEVEIHFIITLLSEKRLSQWYKASLIILHSS